MAADIKTTPERPYGRVRVPRSHRRVMLVLLTGAQGLSGYPIGRAAMVGSGSVYLILARLERLGWVSSEWETPNPLPDGHGRRRFYRLTDEGRRHALEVLGLGEGGNHA